jgi:hypothetical protein
MTMQENGQSMKITQTSRSMLKAVAVAAVFLVFGSNAGSAKAEPDALAGAWTGTGYVTFASGNRERAHCRVHYRPESASTYRAVGTCATASGQVTQTATIRRVSPNAYAGTFHNPEYDVTGSIELIVRSAASQLLRLRADGGSADIILSR